MNRDAKLHLPPRIHRGARSLAGALLEVTDTRRVRLGESVAIRPEGSDEPNSDGGSGSELAGRVVDAGVDRSVVQVLDDTTGLVPQRADVRFIGRLPRVRVGCDLLGRTFDGLGRARDDLPEPVGEAVRSLQARPINPVRRRPPSHFIETGLSAVDGLNTLVRGQKLPIFAGPGLPALEVATRLVEGARTPGDEPFAVVFVAMGLSHREVASFRERFTAVAMERSVLYLNQIGDPTAERLAAPRAALAQAEYLAFDAGLHVLVVMVDVTNYAEALREVASARDLVPGRRGYPGELYSDLASLFERAGLLADRPGSLTQIPVLTLPDDDLTHPIPDLTGYITEGQVVLSRELHRQGVFPPVDVLPSLSRLMKRGIGADRTHEDHRPWADQLYASYAQGREAREMVGIVGETGLSPLDRRSLAFADRFEHDFVHQGSARRGIDETFQAGWNALVTLPRDDLHRLSDAVWQRHLGDRHAEGDRP